MKPDEIDVDIEVGRTMGGTYFALSMWFVSEVGAVISGDLNNNPKRYRSTDRIVFSCDWLNCNELLSHVQAQLPILFRPYLSFLADRTKEPPRDILETLTKALTKKEVKLEAEAEINRLLSEIKTQILCVSPELFI